MFYRLLILMRKEFLQFFRNVPLLIIVLYMATIDVYSAGAISMDIHHFPMGIYDLDRTKESRNVIEKLRKPYFKIAHYLNQEEEITDLIQRGKVSGVLVIPHEFGKKLSARETAELQVILDGSNSNSSEIALGYIANIIELHNSRIIFSKWKGSSLIKESAPFVNAEIRFLYNPNLFDRWSFSLQEFFLIVTLLGMLLIATAMVNEKQFGTIEQLMVTPLRTYEIMFSKIVPMIVILMIASFICVFTILKPVMGIPIRGSIGAFFFATFIYIFTVTGLGLLISTISSNLADTVLFSIFILVPIMFLSGAWVPLESMPAWMRYIVHFSPLKYYLDIGYGVFFKGSSLLMMWKEMLALFGLGFGSFLVGAIRFRKVYQ